MKKTAMYRRGCLRKVSLSLVFLMIGIMLCGFRGNPDQFLRNDELSMENSHDIEESAEPDRAGFHHEGGSDTSDESNSEKPESQSEHSESSDAEEVGRNQVLDWMMPELEQKDSKVTLMIYMTGSDLESKAGAATNDLAEMVSSGIDLDRVDLLVYTGGCTEWFSEIPSDKNTILALTKDGFQEIMRFEECSMGEPESLIRFLNFGWEQFPAEEYGLILWDHGNGPMMGYGKDTLHDGDRMTLTEMREALEASPFSEENKLTFVGFDACLMSSLEVACTVAPFAEYLIASQEVEPCFGWNYSFLAQCGYVTSASLGACVVDSYLQYCSDYFAEHPKFTSDFTLCCMDLSYVEEVHNALDQLFLEASKDVSGGYIQLAMKRVQSHSLGRITTGSEYDLVDLRDLAEQMSERYPEKTADLLNALDKMILCTGTNTVGCGGISFYYPYYNKRYYEQNWKAEYGEFNVLPQYRNYLERYDQVWLGTDMRDFFAQPLSPEEFIPGSYSLRLNPEQAERYASGKYYVLRRYGAGIYSSVACSGDVSLEEGILTANYTGKTIYLVNDYGERFALLADEIYTQNGNTYYVIRYTMNTTSDLTSPAWKVGAYEMVLVLNHETQRVTAEGLYCIGEEGFQNGELQTGKKEFLDTEKWPVLNLQISRPCYPQRDENGNLLPYKQWIPGNWVVMGQAAARDGMNFVYEPFYDDGLEYFLMFEIMDVQGNLYCSEMMPISLSKAPDSIEQEKSYENLVWNQDTESPSILAGDVEISLTASRDYQTGAPIYAFKMVNHNSIDVKVILQNVMVNEALQPSADPVSKNGILVKAGETRYYGYKAINNLLQNGSGTSLEQLQFLLKITRALDGSTLLHGLQVQVDIDIEPEYSLLPLMGAKAGEQILLDQDDVRISLLAWGQSFPKGLTMGDLAASFRFENHSDAERVIRINGIQMNGIAFRLDDTIVLPPNSVALRTESMLLSKEALDGSIHSLAFRISTGEEDPGYSIRSEFENAAWYGVQIELMGETDQKKEYASLYQDDQLTIYDGGVRWDGVTRPQRQILVDLGEEWGQCSLEEFLINGESVSDYDTGYENTIFPGSLTPISFNRYSYDDKSLEFPALTLVLTYKDSMKLEHRVEVDLPAWKEGAES